MGQFKDIENIMFPGMPTNSVSNNALSGAQSAPVEAGTSPSADGSAQPSDFHGIFNQVGTKPQAPKQKAGDKETGADQAAAGLIPIPIVLPAGNLVPQPLPQVLPEGTVAGEVASQPGGTEAANALLDFIMQSNHAVPGSGNPNLPAANNAPVQGAKDYISRALQQNAGNTPPNLSA